MLSSLRVGRERAAAGSGLTRQAGKERGPGIKVEALHLKAVRRAAGMVVRLHHSDAVAVPGKQRGAAQACTGRSQGGQGCRGGAQLGAARSGGAAVALYGTAQCRWSGPHLRCHCR